jgi:hypothetical protein
LLFLLSQKLFVQKYSVLTRYVELDFIVLQGEGKAKDIMNVSGENDLGFITGIWPPLARLWTFSLWWWQTWSDTLLVSMEC